MTARSFVSAFARSSKGASANATGARGGTFERADDGRALARASKSRVAALRAPLARAARRSALMMPTRVPRAASTGWIVDASRSGRERGGFFEGRRCVHRFIGQLKGDAIKC